MAGSLIWIALALGIASAPVQPSETAPARIAARLPAFAGYVVDDARLLGVHTRRRLTARLGRFQHQTGHEIAVVTVADIGGENIAAYTTRLANRWGVGRKRLNDGVVLLLALHPRGVRIAVGSGLKSRLTNSICQVIMDDRIMPYLRRGKVDRGVEAGIAAIVERMIETEPKPSVRRP